MPRFFFHLDDGTPASTDESVELPDLGAARELALRYLGQSLSEGPSVFWSRGDWRLTVTDESRLTLFSVHVVATEAPSIPVEVAPKPVV
jgi:hypothetical protein